MKDWKPGDVLVCVDPGGQLGLSKGESYIIKEIESPNKRHGDRLRLVSVGGAWPYFVKRFIKINV